MADDPRVLKDPAPVAVVSNLGESAITLSLRVWVKNADYWDVMFMFNEKARDALGKEGIDIPFPQRVGQVCRRDGRLRSVRSTKRPANAGLFILASVLLGVLVSRRRRLAGRRAAQPQPADQRQVELPMPR